MPGTSKERLYQDIISRIQTRILAGDLAPGDRLPSERKLAEMLGVSRTAVREALHALAEKGVVEIHVGRGTFVTTPSPDHVAENIHLLLQGEQSALAHLQQAREILEVPIAGLAAESHAAEHLERMQELLGQMRRFLGQPDRFIEADTAFHAELARATGNSVLEALIKPIVDVLREARTFVGAPGVMEQAIRRHEAIYDHVAARDADGARAAMAAHLADIQALI